jgi:hypothetical protein
VVCAALGKIDDVVNLIGSVVAALRLWFKQVRLAHVLTQAIGPSDYLLPEGRPVGGVLPSLTGIPVVGGGRGHLVSPLTTQ